MAIDLDVPAALADLSLASDRETPKLTVILPTRNEKHSIELLLARLGPAVAPLDAELIFVDDSDDDTPDVLAEAARTCPVPVRLLPVFDEYLLGWKDRQLIASASRWKTIQRGGGWLHPVVLVDGRARGTWSSERTTARRRAASAGGSSAGDTKPSARSSRG